MTAFTTSGSAEGEAEHQVRIEGRRRSAPARRPFGSFADDAHGPRVDHAGLKSLLQFAGAQNADVAHAGGNERENVGKVPFGEGDLPKEAFGIAPEARDFARRNEPAFEGPRRRGCGPQAPEVVKRAHAARFGHDAARADAAAPVAFVRAPQRRNLLQSGFGKHACAAARDDHEVVLRQHLGLSNLFVGNFVRDEGVLRERLFERLDERRIDVDVEGGREGVDEAHADGLGIPAVGRSRHECAEKRRPKADGEAPEDGMGAAGIGRRHGDAGGKKICCNRPLR